MLPMSIAVTTLGVLFMAHGLTLMAAEARITMHKACAIGTVGVPDVEGTCEFTPAPGYELVPGGVRFEWKDHRPPIDGCADHVTFEPPMIGHERVTIHAHATQREGHDCGGVMVYHIETAVIPAPPAGYSSAAHSQTH